MRCMHTCAIASCSRNTTPARRIDDVMCDSKKASTKLGTTRRITIRRTTRTAPRSPTPRRTQADDTHARHVSMTATTRTARAATPKVEEKVATTRKVVISEKDAETTTTTDVTATTPVTPAVAVEDSAVKISRATSQEPEDVEAEIEPNAKRTKVDSSAQNDSDFESPEDAGAFVDSQEDGDWQPEGSASE